ncbi:cysteate racemase [Rossellomorea aquimaris]|uniref:aspartate/glutamate racemase family protein n=1 Tax=Rossellomorea aquimaris TaxID=189382 RepID=UPI0009EDA23A|nr:amino acid racemase [Rossellomorea aquimaris]
MEDKTIGILGGMGPLTTITLAEKIIEKTPAKNDQEHLRMIIYNNAKIPSRIDSIIKNSESPQLELEKSAQILEKAGADFIIIPCNTAHYWYKDICLSVKIPVLNIIEETTKYVVNHFQSGSVLLLGTEASIKVGLYEKEFHKHNREITIPNQDEQEVINLAINEVKAGQVVGNKAIQDMANIIEKYNRNGTRTIIAGCTEISILLPHLPSCEKIDPLEILAERAVKEAKMKR